MAISESGKIWYAPVKVKRKEGQSFGLNALYVVLGFDENLVWF